MPISFRTKFLYADSIAWFERVTSPAPDKTDQLCAIESILHSSLPEEPYTDSATAIEPCEIGYIPQAVFFQLLNNSKTFSHQILKNISHEFGVLVNIISVYTHQSGHERLALSLLILHEKFNANNKTGTSLPINLSREDMSNMVGIAVETLVRLLSDFKPQKIITTSGRKISIINPNELMEIVRLS
jgi:CRP-like cAMP-binding protein